MRDVIDVGHDQHTSNVAQLFAIFWLDAISVQVVEEGFDHRVWFGDVHLLGVEFCHLGGVKTSEVIPTGLEDEFVDMNRRGRGRVWIESSLLVLVVSAVHHT